MRSLRQLLTDVLPCPTQGSACDLTTAAARKQLLGLRFKLRGSLEVNTVDTAYQLVDRLSLGFPLNS